jgi:hypothetical protein
MLSAFFRSFINDLADFYEVDANSDVRIGLPVRAIGTMKLAAALRPSTQKLLGLATMQMNAGDFEGAKKSLAKAERMHGDTAPFDIAYRRAICKSMSGDTVGALSDMRMAHSIRPDDECAVYALGSLLAINGRLEDANNVFARDTPVMTGAGHHTYTRALRFPGSAQSQHGVFERVVATQHEPAIRADGLRAVYLVAADSVYFCRYAQALARSIAVFGESRILLHLHIINPNEAAAALMESIASNFDSVRISSESVDLSGLDDFQRKTYYACSRYLMLPGVLEESDCPVIVADMDQLLMSDPQPLLSMADRSDVSLIRFDRQWHNIFSLFSATLLMVSPNPNAQSFARAVAARIESSASNRQDLVWHLDQGALATAYLSNLEIKYGFIPPGMIHLDKGEPLADRPHGEGIFWSITNSIPGNLEKLRMPSFARFSAEKQVSAPGISLFR